MQFFVVAVVVDKWLVKSIDTMGHSHSGKYVHDILTACVRVILGRQFINDESPEVSESLTAYLSRVLCTVFQDSTFNAALFSQKINPQSWWTAGLAFGVRLR